MRGNKKLATACAVANLLRAANADLEDARLLLWRGHQRNAAILAGQALAHTLGAINAAEHGWPARQQGLDGVPAENPLRPELLAIEARLRPSDAPAVRPDGTMSGMPGMHPVQEAVNRLDSVLHNAAEALAVDLRSADPAGHAVPIRPAPPRQKPRTPGAHATWRTGADVPAARGTGADVPAIGKTGAGAPADAAPPPRPRRGRPVIVSTPPRKSRKPRHQPDGAPPGPATPRQPTPSPPMPRPSTPRPSTPGRTQAGRTQAGRTRADRESSGPASAVAPDGPAEPNRPAGSVSHAARDVSSTAFWSLIDKWGLNDLDALRVIGHAGGLTKKGTRPRFRLTGQQAETFAFLHEIDASLNAMGINPSRWLTTSLSEPPYGGVTPLAHIAAHGPAGARDVMHTVTMLGLQRAV